MVAWLLQDMLTDLGCTVVGPAARIAEALTIIDVEAIDAAVLDVNLNGELSYPVADALRARGIPFAFSTGYHKASVWDGYREQAVLQKPYQASDLERVLTVLFPVGPLTTLAA
jgi:CheY-like chemotaxis protein